MKRSFFMMFISIILCSAFSFLPQLLISKGDNVFFATELDRPSLSTQLSNEGKANALSYEMYLRESIWGDNSLKWTSIDNFADAADFYMKAESSKHIFTYLNTFYFENILSDKIYDKIVVSLSKYPERTYTYFRDEMQFIQYNFNNGDTAFTVEIEPQNETVVRFKLISNSNLPEIAPTRDNLDGYIKYLEIDNFDDWQYITSNLSAQVQGAFSEKAQLYVFLSSYKNGINFEAYHMTAQQFKEMQKDIL